jgi:hypothetical protein
MKPGRREWDEQLIRTHLYPHDAEEVLKVRLTERAEEDFIVWHFERSGVFTVKSAYRLAMDSDPDARRAEGSSSSPDGSRSLFKQIWSANLPPKVRIFAWKLMHEGLATQLNRERCTLAKDATCEICGREDESAYHAVIRCTKPFALRWALRQQWELPEEKHFAYTGPDWLLLLLNSVDATTRSKIL